MFQMRKMMIALWLLIVSSSLQAQVKDETILPTTEEEYNYCATGYRLQLQMELPMKRGYKLEDITNLTEGERTFSFKSLYRTGEKKPCAILVIYSRPRVAPLYYCVPSENAPEPLWRNYYTSLANATENEKEYLRVFNYALGRALAMVASNTILETK
ncbi:MAG: hypothetical protein IPO27_10790 [Bacteroidetes bacterium]|nr:hypothetical protein [Bacteroidota bacterium]